MEPLLSKNRPGNRPDQRVRPQGLVEVCLASPLFPPDYTGAGLRFLRYTPGLLERGVRLSVLAAERGRWRDGAGEDEELPQGRDPSGDSLRVRRVSMPPNGGRGARRRAYERALLDTCRSREYRPDAVVTLTRGSVGTLVRIRRTGVPVVYVQTMFPPALPRGPFGRLRILHDRIRYGLLDCTVASSTAMVEALRKSGATGRIEVVPHGVDLDRFRPARDAERARVQLRNRLGIPSQARIVLFVGTLSPRKGLDLLVDAWKYVAEWETDAHLVLAGPHGMESAGGPSSYGAELGRRFTGGKGGARVLFTGRVDRIEEYFQGADVFVLPSVREGMPNVVGEALACGLPSVLTPFLGLSEEFGSPGHEYLLSEPEPEALAGALRRLLGDADLRRTVGLAGQRWAQERMGVDRSLDRYARILAGLVDSPGGPGDELARGPGSLP